MKNKITLTLDIPQDMHPQDVLKELSMIEFALNETHSLLNVNLHLDDLDLDEVGETLKVKKLHPDAVIPTRAYKTALGYDLYTSENCIINNEYVNSPIIQVKFKTGVSIEFPKGFGGKIECRSSLANKGMSIEAGVIDEDYRGEIIIMASFVFSNIVFSKGDKIAQLLLIPTPKFEVEEVMELSETIRGEKGFGSSGK